MAIEEEPRQSTWCWPLVQLRTTNFRLPKPRRVSVWYDKNFEEKQTKIGRFDFLLRARHLLLALRPQVKIASNFITRIGDKLAKEDVEFPERTGGGKFGRFLRSSFSGLDLNLTLVELLISFITMKVCKLVLRKYFYALCRHNLV